MEVHVAIDVWEWKEVFGTEYTSEDGPPIRQNDRLAHQITINGLIDNMQPENTHQITINGLIDNM